jgi:hypothetical protein
MIFILTYPDSLPIIIYEISGKKIFGDNGNCHFYGKAVSKRLKTAGY